MTLVKVRLALSRYNRIHLIAGRMRVISAVPCVYSNRYISRPGWNASPPKRHPVLQGLGLGLSLTTTSAPLRLHPT